ncbi:hypothetical protein M413DRAFT_9365 [Hebeloma cylindrosporum]|uniref:Uncharacterized protein n=1 Tax=Hebeloma cylindrosporum TaxID=76867 RepID=A0A0C2Y2X3_HEBCY|nr:hypothetical protein M413DRAFT_9365 [Hebeloma cylindrosporum h7]
MGVEEWRETMRSLKDAEEEMGNIASNSKKNGSGNVRESLLLNHQRFPSSSSLALSSSGGESPSPSPSRPLSSSFSSSAKLAAAQSELQAGETHLAAEECANTYAPGIPTAGPSSSVSNQYGRYSKPRSRPSSGVGMPLPQPQPRPQPQFLPQAEAQPSNLDDGKRRRLDKQITEEELQRMSWEVERDEEVVESEFQPVAAVQQQPTTVELELEHEQERKEVRQEPSAIASRPPPPSAPLPPSDSEAISTPLTAGGFPPNAAFDYSPTKPGGSPSKRLIGSLKVFFGSQPIRQRSANNPTGNANDNSHITTAAVVNIIVDACRDTRSRSPPAATRTRRENNSSPTSNFEKAVLFPATF